MDLPSLSVSRKIVRNTIFNSIGRFWTALAALFLTPYIVSKLGVQIFGVWSLVLVLVDYSGYLDLGTGASLVKFISEYHTREEYEAINGIVSTGFSFYLLSTMIGAGLVYTFSDGILHFFKIPLEIYGEAHFALMVIVGVLALSSVSSVFQAIVTGLQRMEVINVTVIATSALNITGTIVSLELGYGLRGLIITQFVVVMVTAALLGIYSFRLLPSLKLGPSFLSIVSLQRLLGYGIKVQVTNVGALASLQTSKILIGYFLNLGLVAFYELGFKIAYTITSLPMLLISAITPAAAELEARNNDELLHELYARGSKYLFLVVAPMACFTILTAPSIMSIWMGEGYERSVLVIQALTLGFSFNLLTGVGTTMARGIGKPEYEMKYGLVTIVLNILLGVALITKLGFSGVLIATLLAAITGSTYFMSLFHRYLGKTFMQFAKETYPKPIIASLLAGLLMHITGFTIDLFCPPSSRLVSVAILGLKGAVFLGSYLITILKSQYLDHYDRRLLFHIPFEHASGA